MASDAPATTTVSNFATDRDAAAYGQDGFWQLDLTKQALYDFVTRDNHTAFLDLRGKTLTVTVADDGLSVAVKAV